MKLNQLEPQKFSEYFKLNQNNEFDFVDIYAYQDIPLFLDPFGISAMGTRWAKECESQIATYFQYLIDCINTGDKRTTTRLLNALHEVNEIALGYSSGVPQGRGIGGKQAQQIQRSFETSEAAKSGDIKDIADCAILIPGISRDKISDITANILKRKLVEYTQRQCEKYNIPTEKVAINNAFDYDTFQFTSYFSKLPVIDGHAKILLPISSVRQDPELSKNKYYRNFVLEFLKAEHQHAGDALSTVLRNGSVVVRIMDLKEKYPMNVDFLYQFSKSHPKVLEKYKSELRRTAIKKGKAQLKTQRKILNSIERRAIMESIKTGRDDATRFHKIAYDNLIHILSGRASNPLMEKEINEGRKRIDIIFNNSDKKGFFHLLNTKYHVKCPKIIVECKNYGKEIGNPEVDQINGRLNDNRGRFGIIVCRSIEDKPRLLSRCKDLLNDNRNYVVVLEDKDIIQLLEYRDKIQEQEIDDFFERKIDQIIM
ncbi:MAG: hypothetical protein COA57_05725 [Flavobacteriales bacterium]|nr:MAG: hypothetical protein COA57_05725 [Flavobacteriales bacterium]